MSRIVLEKFNVKIDGKTSAFIGASGCGKSTILQLIMRFYDPEEGEILLDGIQLKDIDIDWLRSQIGYITQ